MERTMSLQEIEKLNQLVSREDMSGNQKVEWLKEFIEAYAAQQTGLRDDGHEFKMTNRSEIRCVNCTHLRANIEGLKCTETNSKTPSDMKVEIENLGAQMRGVNLTPYQRGLALNEYYKLIEYVDKLEQQTEVDLEKELENFETDIYPRKPLNDFELHQIDGAEKFINYLQSKEEKPKPQVI